MNSQRAVASRQGAERVAPGNVNGHPGDTAPRATHTLSSQTTSFQLSLHSFPSVSYALINDSTHLLSAFQQSPPQGHSGSAGTHSRSVMTLEWTHGLLFLDVSTRRRNRALPSGRRTVNGVSFLLPFSNPFSLERMEKYNPFLQGCEYHGSCLP